MDNSPTCDGNRCECCEDHDCSVWATIAQKTEDGKWCLEWLRHLKDFEASHGLPDTDHQVSLMVDHTDNEVRHIRSKLAFLQSQTPVWKIIDQIHEQAEAKAVLFKNELHKANLKRNASDSYERPASSEKSVLDLSDDQAVIETKKKDDYDKQTKLILRAKRERYYNILKRYVRVHITCMLKRLYSNLKKEEEDLQTIFAEDHAIDTVTDELWVKQFRRLEEKNLKIGRQLELEKYWFGILYRVPDVNSIYEADSRSTDEADSRSLKSKNCLRIVGPVGERPLHVCALSAFRFGSVNFEGVGNYLSEGILQGMMEYIENENNPGVNVKGFEEWKAQYGKDYCAAVGNFLLRDEKHACGKRKSNFKVGALDPPHWPQICKWKRAHMTNGNSRMKPCCNLNAPDWYAKTLVRNGLYEGETILFPLIAGKAENTIHKLLEMEKSESQGDIAIFNQLFYKLAEILEKKWAHEKGGEAEQEKKGTNLQIQKNLLDAQDRYGNTLLHVAAWNEMTAIYDRLIQLGANPEISNRDGLTPFTLTARLGIWSSFNHIWDRHLTKTVWQFGNVTRHKSDYKSFDWKGIKTFLTKHEVQSCKEALFEILSEIFTSKNAACDDFSFNLKTNDPVDPEVLNSLRFKYRVVYEAAKDWKTYMDNKPFLKFCERFLKEEESQKSEEDIKQFHDLFDEAKEDSEQRSAIRMITLFRPHGWYNHTKERLEEVILHKWSNGYHLVHLGQSLVPYCVIILIFGLMWWKRELHILQHNLWWATPEATLKLSDLPSDQVFRNPVVADIPELLRLTDGLGTEKGTGTWTFQSGQLRPESFGEESKCGWRAIRDSTSGRLQAVQAIYGVFSLLRLAYSQRRLRPSDWDQNEDTIITADETVNFIYLNLEVFLHIILSGLYMAIAIARVAAGEKCIDNYVQIEKSATAVTALFLFANLFTVGKPYEGIGLLVLTTYKFIVSDVFIFIIMYCTFFIGFLLALQTMYNSERVYLAWLDLSPSVFSQVKAITNGSAYLANSDMPGGAVQLLDTQMNMEGCSGLKMPIYATAWMLLQVSVGDGLANSIEQMQQSDFECAGFQPDPFIFYILVLWVFLTNVLILNMLIAMMNYTFDRQKSTVHSVWLLDLSYRIMRFERLFPELIDRMQTRHVSYSFWRLKFWRQLFLDCCLVVYCIPEIHFRGFSHRTYVWLIRSFRSILEWIQTSRFCQSSASNMESSRLSLTQSYITTVHSLIKNLSEKREKQAIEAENDARVRAGVKTIENMNMKKPERGCMDLKEHLPETKLKFMMMLPEVFEEVNKWCTYCSLKKIVTAQTENAVMDQNAQISQSTLSTWISQSTLSTATLGFLSPPYPLQKDSADSQNPEAGDQEGQLGLLIGSEANTLPGATQHGSESAAFDEGHEESSDREKLLLVISLIYRLHLLQEEYRGSCMVISTFRSKSGRAAAQSIYAKDNDSDYCTDTDTD